MNKAAPIKSQQHPQSNQPHASTPQKASSSSALKDVTCYYCNKAGHKSPDCHKKKKDLENAKKGKAGQQCKAAQNTAQVCYVPRLFYLIFPILQTLSRMTHGEHRIVLGDSPTILSRDSA